MTETTIEHPPIRYSVGQPDYDQEIGRRLRIMVDGVEMKEVIEYDCEAGLIVRFKLGEDGRPMLNAKRDEIVRETVHGIVTVEWKD